jgi:hypothetical protein
MINITLTDTAELFGLKPRSEATGRVRFICPSCGETNTSKPKRTAHGWDNAPCTWWCYRCSTKGFYFDIYKMFGQEAPKDDLLDTTNFKPIRRPAPKPVSSHINVAQGWSALLSEQESSDPVYNYLTLGRGFPPVVAKALSELSDDVAWSYGNGAIARRANSVNRHLLIALRDAEAKVVNVSRRWGLPNSPNDDKPKAMVLSTKDTGGSQAYAGNIMAFGDIPHAIEVAKSAPLYIVEGGPDYLAMQGLVLSGTLNGAVLGAYNVTSMIALTKHILDSLNASSAILPRVVFVPHVNDTPLKGDVVGVGERTALNCAQMLVGRAGVFMAKIPAPQGVEGDLSDLLQYRGVADVISTLTTATLVAAAPVAIESSMPVIKSRMSSAIIKACSTKGMVVYQVDAGAGKSYAALGMSSEVALGNLQIAPNGKTDSPLRSVVFATPSNALAEEKYKAFSMMFPSTPARMAYGAMHYCAYRAQVETEFAILGRRGVCGIPKFTKTLCDQYSTCQGAQVPEPVRGEVMFTSHAMARNIKADLVIIDEDCGVIGTDNTSQADIVTLFNTSSTQKRVKAWMNVNNADAPAGAFYFNKVASDALSNTFMQQGGIQYDVRINGADLFKLMSQSPLELGAFMQGFAEDAIRPPKALPNQVRSGWNMSRYLPSQKAFSALVALRASLAENMKPQADRNAFLASCVSLVLGSKFTWHLEVKELSALPDAPILLLDATGAHVMGEWQAAVTDRPVVFDEIIVQGAAPASAIHIDSKGFSRSICIDNGQVDHFCADRVESVLARLASEVRAKGCKGVDERVTLAMLSHRPVYDAMAGFASYPNGKAVKERVDALCAELRVDLMLGYYGRHDRGTNEFEGVDGLVVCGDPRGNLGDAEQDAALIGVSLDDSYKGRTMATAVQAINRARHLRRSTGNRVVLMFVGAQAPSLRGFAWDVEDLSRRAYKTHTDDLLQLVRHIAQHDGVISPYSVKMWDCSQHPSAPQVDNKSAHAQKVTRAITFCANELGWASTQVKLPNGRLGRVYAPTSDFARRWKDAGCPVGIPYVD